MSFDYLPTKTQFALQESSNPLIVKGSTRKKNSSVI